jgi:uncharacterized SAM-binding protein YcdF (DUF218 family)
VHRLLRTAIRAMTSIGVLLVVITLTPTVRWWAEILRGPWQDAQGDVLIVLGGSMLSDGTVGESSYWRAIYAAKTFREGGFSRMFISGGGVGMHSVARSMVPLVMILGVPLNAITTEERSLSTRENALYLQPLLYSISGRKVLITSDYHIYRAARTFRKVGIRVNTVFYPDIGKRCNNMALRWGCFLDLSLETCKIIYYWANGWI